MMMTRRMRKAVHTPVRYDVCMITHDDISRKRGRGRRESKGKGIGKGNEMALRSTWKTGLLSRILKTNKSHYGGSWRPGGI